MKNHYTAKSQKIRRAFDRVYELIGCIQHEYEQTGRDEFNTHKMIKDLERIVMEAVDIHAKTRTLLQMVKRRRR
ncbi:hypothetical protein HOO68_05895 [Candidatus Gracilibacteria bacterium]|nr:hypothetical protein [Candidatus Gracilibacteria bacterium]